MDAYTSANEGTSASPASSVPLPNMTPAATFSTKAQKRVAYNIKPLNACPGASWTSRYPRLHLLLSSQSMTANITRKAREAQPQLAGERRGADNLLLAALELVDVPGSEDELAVEELGLG